MMMTGQTYWKKKLSVAMSWSLLRRRFRSRVGERRALGHHRRGARDRVCKIEVGHRGGERRLAGRAAKRRELLKVGGVACGDLAQAHEVRMRREHQLAQAGERV